MKIQSLLMIMSFLALFSCKTPELATVEKLDITKYAGTWYEIARFPNSFEKGLECVTATYTLKDNGKIEVFNRGIKVNKNNKVSEIKGSAKVKDPDYPARLKVTFFWPFAGDYYVIALDENYQYALVGGPSRDFLWVLARQKSLDEESYQKLLAIARENKFDTSRLKKVRQNCK